ncbi:MAG: hypothetical protein FWH11_09900 [Micrococcales bacterium]|nr:hypothetical protein [Micrococcales bacterium]
MTQMHRLAVVALGGVLLVGCSGGAGADGDSTTPGNGDSATPGTEFGSFSPSVRTDAEPPNLPTDCDALGSAATRAKTVGDLEPYDAAPEPVQSAPQGATLELGCEWFGGDVTGVTVTISTAAPDTVAAAADTLGSQGYTCTQDLGGRLCTASEESSAEIYGGPGATIEVQRMVFARDGVWVFMSTSNRDGQALLLETVADIFD